MTAVAAEAAVVVDNGRETSGETSLWHGAAARAAARVDQLLRRISDLTRFDRVSCGRWLASMADCMGGICVTSKRNRHCHRSQTAHTLGP